MGTQQHEPVPVFGSDWTVTPKAAASMLGMPQRRVQHLMEHGDLEFQQDGSWRLIPLDSLFAYRRRLQAGRAAVRPSSDKERPPHDR